MNELNHCGYIYVMSKNVHATKDLTPRRCIN